MPPKKTNAQKARERRRMEGTEVRAQERAESSDAPASSQPLQRESRSLESRKRLTVLAVIALAVIFGLAVLAVERWAGNDSPDSTPTVEAASAPGNDGVTGSPVASLSDPELSTRCWPNGGPVPGMANDAASPPSMGLAEGVTYSAVITTNYGAFTVEFFPEDAPNTVNNFVCLANEGYYNDTLFHRVIAGFMFQGGDPLGTGAGGPGYRFDDEPIVRDYTTGTLAMANAGPNTNGSQFFVILDNLTELGRLPKNYTIFGQVTSGMETVEAIGAVPVEQNPNNPNEISVPVDPVQLISVEIIATPSE